MPHGLTSLEPTYTIQGEGTLKPMIFVALAAGLALTACGGGSPADAGQKTVAPATTTGSAPAPVAKTATTPTPAAPKVDPLVGKPMPAANGKPAPNTPEQQANDLIACEAGKNAGSGTPPQIPADAFEKAKARIAADPQALEKCRAG